MKLTLIRHGRTEGNERRLYYGSTDLPLLERSVSELAALGLSGSYPKAEHYYTSGMTRAEQTLEALYGPVPHEILTDMREIDFGDFEMRTYEELKLDPAFIEWCTGDNEKNVCPGGESGVMVTERALRCLAPIIAADEDAVIITHGGVIGGVMASFFPGPDGRYRFTPEPGEGYTAEFIDGIPVSVTKIP